MTGVKLISCVDVDGDLALLPHFLRHYHNLGIPSAAMRLILNAESKDTPALAEATRILESFSIKPAEVWIAPYTSGAMWEKRRKLQARIASEQDWVISADVDEFHEYPESLPSLLRRCDRMGVNCIQGVFIDRLTSTGQLLDPSTEEFIEERYPIQADVICSIGQTGREHDWYGTVKIMACKGNVLPSRGGHHPTKGETPVRFLAGRTLASFPTIAEPWFRFSFPFRVHHYKWTANLVPGLRRRISATGASAAGREYGAILLNYIERHGGINLRDVSKRRIAPLELLPWRLRLAALRRLPRLWNQASAFHKKLRRSAT